MRSTSPAISSTMMVEVVEAMIGLGPASTDARADASRLRSSTSGTASKITATEAKAGRRPKWGQRRSALLTVPTWVFREQADASKARHRRRHRWQSQLDVAETERLRTRD